MKASIVLTSLALLTGLEILMARTIEAVVAGHLCIDVYPTFPAVSSAGESPSTVMSRILVPGKLVEVGPLAVSTGGPVSNTGLALLKLGINAVLMGKVGTDAFGLVVKKLLAEMNADKHLIVVDGETTSYTVGLAIPGVDRVFLHHPGSNDTFCADDVNYEIVGQAKLFHIGYPPLMKRMYSDGGDELSTILRRVHELGTITTMDMALPDPSSPAGKADWPFILAKSLPHVDVFLPSAEETLYMIDRPKFDRVKREAGNRDMLDLLTGADLAELAGRLLDFGCKVAAIKCGHRGIYVRTASFANPFGTAGGGWSHRELWEPVFRVDKFVSTAGSGDSTIAGFLSALLRGHSLEDCLKYATATGAENVEALDTVSGIRSWAETTARIKSGWQKVTLANPGLGWCMDELQQTWIGPANKGMRG